MLRSRWTQVDIGAVRIEIDDLLKLHAVSRCEPFYRPKFYEFLVSLGPGGQWGVPLIDKVIMDMAERVLA